MFRLGIMNNLLPGILPKKFMYDTNKVALKAGLQIAMHILGRTLTAYVECPEQTCSVSINASALDSTTELPSLPKTGQNLRYFCASQINAEVAPSLWTGVSQKEAVKAAPF